MAKLSEYEYAFYFDDQLVMITNVDEIGKLMLDVEVNCQTKCNRN